MDNFTLTRWDKTDYEALTAHLLSMKDPAYKDFHQKLIPGVENFIGVRTPAVKALAKEIAKGDAESFLQVSRSDYYEQAMLDAGLVPYSVMVEQSSSYSSGIELIRQARREYPQLDGIFCTNDDLAVGAAFECQRLGLKIPDDMAIAGFHGHDIGQVMEPRLASVLTPRERMGSIGAERLLARIRGESVTPKMLDLGFTLSPGGSI